MNKHTPGPWKLREGMGGTHMLVAETDSTPNIAAISLDRNWGMANAHLIAAAPQLLEALELLTADVQGYPAWERPCLALDKAIAAIKAARGGE